MFNMYKHNIKYNMKYKIHNGLIFIPYISQYVAFIAVKDENKKSKISLESLPKLIVLLHQDIMGTTTIKMGPT